MDLVHLVETIIQKRLILPGIGKLSNVALFDLYVRKYNSVKYQWRQGHCYAIFVVVEKRSKQKKWLKIRVLQTGVLHIYARFHAEAWRKVRIAE